MLNKVITYADCCDEKDDSPSWPDLDSRDSQSQLKVSLIHCANVFMQAENVKRKLIKRLIFLIYKRQRNCKKAATFEVLFASLLFA